MTRFSVPPMMPDMARTPAGPLVPAGPGLFAALGGRPGIGVIVDGLYDRLERDGELARHFRSRRPGERERLKQFFETIFGGEAIGIRAGGPGRCGCRRPPRRGTSPADRSAWRRRCHGDGRLSRSRRARASTGPLRCFVPLERADPPVMLETMAALSHLLAPPAARMALEYGFRPMWWRAP